MNTAKMTRTTVWACLFLLLSLAAAAEAPWNYQVLTVNRGGTSKDAALAVGTTDHGHIAYHHARLQAPALWLKVEAKEGETIPLQFGVPMLDRYRHARPALAILSPELPALNTSGLPFTVPEDMGGVILSTHMLASHQYRDAYTGVISWRFDSMQFTPPATGTYYVVAFTPENEQGGFPETKFWLSVGKGKSFRFGDLFTLYGNNLKIRGFFEEAVFVSQLFSTTLWVVLLSIIGIVVAMI